MRPVPILPILCGLLLWPWLAYAAPCEPLVLTSVIIHEETAGFVIDAEYPVLCRNEANPVIRDFVSDTVFGLKMLDPGHDLTTFPHQFELTTRYAVWPSPGGRYASVKLNVSVYSGGAHANHWPMTWVFDLSDGRVLTLADLFTDPDAALNELSAGARAVLPAALGEMHVPEMLEAGTEPVEENFRRFILTLEGVAVFFAPYQVAPFAAGEQVVTIPFARLEPWLRPELLETIAPL